MFVSFLIVVIVAIIGVTVGELSATYDFLLPYVEFLNYALYGAIAIFLVFTVISIIKAIKK